MKRDSAVFKLGQVAGLLEAASAELERLELDGIVARLAPIQDEVGEFIDRLLADENAQITAELEVLGAAINEEPTSFVKCAEGFVVFGDTAGPAPESRECWS